MSDRPDVTHMLLDTRYGPELPRSPPLTTMQAMVLHVVAMLGPEKTFIGTIREQLFASLDHLFSPAAVHAVLVTLRARGYLEGTDVEGRVPPVYTVTDAGHRALAESRAHCVALKAVFDLVP